MAERWVRVEFYGCMDDERPVDETKVRLLARWAGLHTVEGVAIVEVEHVLPLTLGQRKVLTQ